MSKEKKKQKIEILNRKATFEYYFVQEYDAGIMLTGSEIKSIRSGNANLSDAYCLIENGEIWVRNLYIAEYEFGSETNHLTRRTRKLLLRKPELRKLDRGVREKGSTIVPFKLYISDRGFAKLSIALARGKKMFDKRETIKEREGKRDMDRINKAYKIR
ncbi:MAG TPA: SsrA-binding protein SmpB [Saprospiraceae bacterium]|nr:SsrA-binding protein SmpB [Saprospiraceae bacterium]HPI07742.1 SsrA-binding protein SmpB [Saprospiraceae bacterium]